jgi:hypothetical protein
MSFEPATVEVIRGETDEGGDLLAAHLAELRQQSDEGEGERGADASGATQYVYQCSKAA